MGFDPFILGIISSWALICIALGFICGARMLATRTIQSAVIVFALWPWYAHHWDIIEMGNSAIEQWRLPIANIGYVIKYQAPLMVAFVTLCVLTMPRTWRRLFIVFIPGIAFLSTYYMTFPLVYAYVPNFHYDNVPNVWLFVWLSGATLFLCIWSCSKKKTKKGTL